MALEGSCTRNRELQLNMHTEGYLSPLCKHIPHVNMWNALSLTWLNCMLKAKHQRSHQSEQS